MGGLGVGGFCPQTGSVLPERTVRCPRPRRSHREENGLLNKESFVPTLRWLLTGPEDLQVSAPAKKGGLMEGPGLAGSTPWPPGWQHSLRHIEAVGRSESVCGVGHGI